MSALRPLALAILLATPCIGAAQEVPETTPELLDAARTEIARLRATLQQQEAETAKEFAETQRALRNGETSEQTGIQLGVARRYLSAHPLVHGMDTTCHRAFSQLADGPSRAIAEDCISTAPISQNVPVTYGCARLTLETTPTGLTLAGYVSKDEDFADLANKFGAAMVEGVDVRPYPVCRALDTLGFTNTMEPTPDVELLSRASNVAIGESLAFDVTTPEVPSFLYLVYMQADDTVVNLLPKRGPLREQYAPNTRIRFGDGVEDPRVFTASAPTGPEAIVAIAARSPLDGLDDFESGPYGQYLGDGNRPASRAEFLDQLDLALKDFKETPNGEREISFDLLYLVVTN